MSIPFQFIETYRESINTFLTTHEQLFYNMRV